MKVAVLIDRGATYNFITSDLVAKSKLPIFEPTKYGVVMGSGNKLPEVEFVRS
ncbi:unnamed protein product [Dovyalis caffra]|uniref:Uncharacterized protein n=1 Tax=Dovyalis caffra TaxID=77055 RepID=A0AAV1SFA2_9ROSI|nr:unnamed protein product [Dovyalis caffra]